MVKQYYVSCLSRTRKTVLYKTHEKDYKKVHVRMGGLDINVNCVMEYPDVLFKISDFLHKKAAFKKEILISCNFYCKSKMEILLIKVALLI